MAGAPEFYVYQLSDPRTGKPFYVGKGKGKRIDSHEAEAKTGSTHPKCQTIRDIVSAGLCVKKDIIKRFKSESAAYRFEERQIKLIGLDNLTNIAKGGVCCWPRKDVDPQLTKDKELVKAIAVIYHKTLAFTVDSCFTFVGVTVPVGKKTYIALKKHLAEVEDRRGKAWVNVLIEASHV